MTLKEMLKEAGIKRIVEGEFQHEVEPPYICYLRSSSDNVSADSKVVYSKYIIAIELYCEKGDKKSCELLKAALNKHNVDFTEGVFWIGGDQQLYEYVYTIRDKEDY